MSDPFAIPCRELVELLTDYLEGNLDRADVERVDAHLGVCPPCADVLEQFRRTIDLTGQLGEQQLDGIDPDVRAELMQAFAAVHRPAL